MRLVWVATRLPPPFRLLPHRDLDAVRTQI